MLGGDGTGPVGQGHIGRFRQGGNFARDQGGRGRMGGPYAAGPGGLCKCPKCGHEQAHARGQPCFQIKCPKCGSPMVRS